MKKAMLVLVVLALLGGTAFFFGWTQFAVPPSSYGVMSSKTSGVSARVLVPGRFSWSWERLLPTNARIIVLSLRPAEQAFSASFTLPEGALYAEAIGGGPSFTFKGSGTLKFSVRPEALPSLVRDRGVTDQESLDRWIGDTAKAAADFLVKRLENLAAEVPESDRLLIAGSNPRVLADLQRSYPELEDVSYILDSLVVPDIELYGKARAAYAENAAKIAAAIGARSVAAAASERDLDARMAELERYGKLLAQYPALLDYLRLESQKSAGAGPEKE